MSRTSTGRRMSARRTRTVAAAGAVLLVGALTACSGGQPGAAAVIDGDRVISASEVDTATRELSSLLSGVTPSTVLSVLILQPVVAEVAAAHDATVSSSEAEAQLATNATDSDQQFSDSSVAVMTYVLEVSALQQADDTDAVSAELTAAQADLDVEINPRYGTLGADGTIGTTSYDWIVATAEAASGTSTDAP